MDLDHADLSALPSTRLSFTVGQPIFRHLKRWRLPFLFCHNLIFCTEWSLSQKAAESLNLIFMEYNHLSITAVHNLRVVWEQSATITYKYHFVGRGACAVKVHNWCPAMSLPCTQLYSWICCDKALQEIFTPSNLSWSAESLAKGGSLSQVLQIVALSMNCVGCSGGSFQSFN